jgi:NTE family protein
MDTLVISGGALGGFAVIGALQALHDKYHFTTYAGCSVGSIIATLLSIGYTYTELAIITESFKYEEFADLQILGLVENLGIETGSKIIKLIKKLIHRKTGLYDLTFRQHWRITGRHLWINASCVELDECHYFSYKNSPDLSILSAIRMSIALPFVITAVKWGEYTYVDGGLHNSFPISIFAPEKTLGIKLVNNNSMPEGVHPFIKHTAMILGSLYKRIYEQQYQDLQKKYKIIEIQTGISTYRTSVDKDTKDRLIDKGYQAGLLFLSQLSQLSQLS